MNILSAHLDQWSTEIFTQEKENIHENNAKQSHQRWWKQVEEDILKWKTNIFMIHKNLLKFNDDFDSWTAKINQTEKIPKSRRKILFFTVNSMLNWNSIFIVMIQKISIIISIKKDSKFPIIKEEFLLIVCHHFFWSTIHTELTIAEISSKGGKKRLQWLEASNSIWTFLLVSQCHQKNDGTRGQLKQSFLVHLTGNLTSCAILNLHFSKLKMRNRKKKNLKETNDSKRIFKTFEWISHANLHYLNCSND